MAYVSEVRTFSPGSEFSDLAVCRIELDGNIYPTVDHYVQIELLRAFGLLGPVKQLSSIMNPEEFRRQLEETLRKARNDGTLSFHLTQSWIVNNSRRLLKKANYHKFMQNSHLKMNLLETEHNLLIYTSKNNRVTGIGMTETEFRQWEAKQKFNPQELLVCITEAIDDIPKMLKEISASVVGANLLGITLMEIRAELRGETFHLPVSLSPGTRSVKNANELILEKVADVAVSPSDLQPGVVIQAQTPRTESQKRIEALLKKVVQQSVRVRKESKLKRPGSAHCDPDVPRPSEPTGLLKSVSILRNERRIVYSTTVPSMAQHRKDALKQRMIELKLKKLKAQRFIEIETEVKLLVRHLVTVVSDSLHFYGDSNDTNPKQASFNEQLAALEKFKYLSDQRRSSSGRYPYYTESISEFPVKNSTIVSLDDDSEEEKESLTPTTSESRKTSRIPCRFRRTHPFDSPNLAFRRNLEKLEKWAPSTASIKKNRKYIGSVPSRASGFIQALQKRQRNLRLQSAGNIKHTVLEESNSSSVPPFFINPLYTTDNDHILPACLQPKRVSHDCQLSQRQPPKNSAVFTKDNQELQNSAELSNKTVQTITPAPFIMNLDSNNLRDLLSHYNFRLKEIDGKLGEANVDFVNGELIRYNGKIVQVITQLPPRPNPHTKQIGKPTIPPLPPQWALRLVTRKHNKRKKKKSDVTEKPIHFADIKEAMQYQADLWVKGGRLASTGKFERVGEYVMSGDDVRNCTDAEDMIAGPSEASNSQQSAISYGQSTPNDLLTISNSIRSLADFYSDTIIKKSSKLTASKSELHVRKEPFHERSQLESNWKEILIKKEPPSYLEEVKHPLEWYSKPESARLLQTVLPNEDWRNNFQSEVWFQDTSGFQDWLTMADFAESTEERAEAPGDSTLESLDIQSMRQWFKDYKVLIDSRLTAERLEKQLAEDMKITENMINVKVEPEDDYEEISYIGYQQGQPASKADMVVAKRKSKGPKAHYYKRQKNDVIAMSDGSSGVSSDGGISLFSRAVHYDEFLQNLRQKSHLSS